MHCTTNIKYRLNTYMYLREYINCAKNFIEELMDVQNTKFVLDR